MGGAAGALVIVGAGIWFTRPPAVLGDITRYAFLHSSGSAEIRLFDTVDAQLAGKIELGGSVETVLISRQLGLLVGSDQQARTVRIFDFATLTESVGVELPFAPGPMLTSPDGLQLAVTNPVSGQVAIISLSDKSLKGVIEGFNAPEKLSFSDDSGFLFFPDNLTGEIEVVMVDSGQRLDPIVLTIGTDGERDLSALTRTPNGLYGLIAERQSGTLSVVNFRNWAEQTVLEVGSLPTRPYITADGQYVIVPNDGDKTVSIISTLTLMEEATLPGLADVTSVATGYFETHAYLVSRSAGKVLAIDLTTMEIVDEITIEGTLGVAVADADGRRVYVPHSNPGGLAIIDAFEHQLIRDVDIAGFQPQLAVLAETNNYCH
jgi:DNA-binding beta-propeller fold protein YncE